MFQSKALGLSVMFFKMGENYPPRKKIAIINAPKSIRQYHPYPLPTIELKCPVTPMHTFTEPILTAANAIPYGVHAQFQTRPAPNQRTLSTNPRATRGAIWQSGLDKMVPAFPPLVTNGLARVRTVHQQLDKLYGKKQILKKQGFAQKTSQKGQIKELEKNSRACQDLKTDKVTPSLERLSKVVRLFDRMTTGKKILSGKEGRYVKQIKKQISPKKSLITISLTPKISSTRLVTQALWLVTHICMIYEQKPVVKNTREFADQLVDQLRDNPAILEVNADDGPNMFSTWGQHTGLEIQETTNKASLPMSCTMHLISSDETLFSNSSLENNFVNRIKGVKDLEFSRTNKPKKTQSLWAFLSLEAAIKVFLRVREFKKGTQESFIRDHQTGYLAFINSSTAYNTVFCLSTGSFTSYALHLNSLAEFCLLINKTWYTGTNFEKFQETKETKLDGHWVLDQIINKTINVDIIQNWVLWLCGKRLALSSIRTKLAGISFFFEHIHKIRVADFWSLKSVYPFIKYFDLDTKHGADYANPMIRIFLICDVLKKSKDLQHMYLPCVIAHLFGPRPNELLAAREENFVFTKQRDSMTVTWTIPKVKNCLHAQVKKINIRDHDVFCLKTLFEKRPKQNHPYVCLNAKKGHLNYRIFASDLRKAVKILKQEWKKHSNNDISDLKFTAYTFRISKFNDLFFQGYTAEQIITLSGHASAESLTKSYLCHADSIWSNGLSDCFLENMSEKKQENLFENLTNLSIRNIRQNMVHNAITDTVLADQTENTPQICIHKAMEQIFPEIPSASHGIMSDNDYEFSLQNPLKKSQWQKDNLEAWENRHPLLCYKPSEIMKKPKFQKEVFDPITAKLLIKKQELKQYLEDMTDKPLTPEARKSITNFFTTLSAEVAKDQLILLKKFFFQNEENNLSEKKQKATN